jgi:hypothetical protein
MVNSPEFNVFLHATLAYFQLYVQHNIEYARIHRADTVFMPSSEQQMVLQQAAQRLNQVVIFVSL